MLLLFLIATAGMTYIVIEGQFPLVKWVREKVEQSENEVLQDLWSCHMCMGWWCGLFMALLIYPIGWLTFPLACAGSAASYMWSKLVDTFSFGSQLSMLRSQLANLKLTNAIREEQASKDEEDADA